MEISRADGINKFLNALPDFDQTALAKVLPEWPVMEVEAIIRQTLAKLTDIDWEQYLIDYPDVRDSGIAPLEHFAQYGIQEARRVKRKTTCVKGLRLTRQGAVESFADFPLQVDWQITKMCNYDCSYCFGHQKLDKSKFTPFAMMQKGVDHIAELNRSIYKFSFGGGEPTTHPQFFELLYYLHHKLGSKLNNIFIVTNGSRQESLYEKLKFLSSLMNINLTISVHSEFADIDHIISVIRTMANSVYISLNFMLNPARRETCSQYFEKLLAIRKDYPFHLNILLLRSGPKFDVIDARYTDSDYSFRANANRLFCEAAKASAMRPDPKNRKIYEFFWHYRESGEEKSRYLRHFDRGDFMQKGFFQVRDMYCCIGSTALAIQPDGKTYGAQCYLPPKKYNIFQENPYRRPDFIAALRCSCENCGCAVNDALPKFADAHEAELYVKAAQLRQEKLLAARQANMPC